MTVPAEVIFDRTIRARFPPYCRDRYVGKADIDPLKDRLLHDAQHLINDMYASHAPHFRTATNEVPRLHFDFIDGSAVNALAFNEAGYSFVGLTVPLVDVLAQYAAVLVASRDINALLDHEPLDEDGRGQRWTALTITMLQFVAFHELGHHICGHCPDSDTLSVAVFEEYGRGSTAGNTALSLQAAELDADEYAVRTLADNLFVGPARSQILVMLGCPVGEASDDHLLTALTLAAGMFFFCRTTTSAIDFYKVDHPPAAARLALAMEALHDWLLTYRPRAAAWVSGNEYHRAMDAATKALNNDGTGEIWNMQTDRLTSPAGDEYLDKLEQAKRDLRATLKEKQWRHHR